jgi:hypothetical protein
MTIQLFKIITTRDEIVIGFKAEEMTTIGGTDAAAIGRKLVADGSLGVWQYAVRRAADGSLEQGPLRQVAVLASDSLRVEPYASPLPVASH